MPYGYIKHDDSVMEKLYEITVRDKVTDEHLFMYDAMAAPSVGDLIEVDGKRYLVHFVVCYPRHPNEFAALVSS